MIFVKGAKISGLIDSDEARKYKLVGNVFT